MFVFNKHNGAITKFLNSSFNSLCVFDGKVLGATTDGIYEVNKEGATTGINANFSTGLIDLGGKAYTTDAFLERYEVKAIDMAIESKEGVRVEYAIVENQEKVNLAKGHKSRYFSIELLTDTIMEIKEILLVVEEVDRIG